VEERTAELVQAVKIVMRQ